MKTIYKILRITSVILVILIPPMIFSGFFMTKNFLVPWVDYGIAAKLHGFILLVVLLPALYLHSLAGVLISLQRRPSLNNNVVRAFIVFFWTALLVAMGYFLFAQAPAIAPSPQKSVPANPSSDTPPAETADTTLTQFTLAEIAAHSTPDDCWLLIDGKVYDATPNIAKHPGGEKNITDNCGKDATQVFSTKNDKGIPHSEQAMGFLATLLIGELSQ